MVDIKKHWEGASSWDSEQLKRAIDKLIQRADASIGHRLLGNDPHLKDTSTRFLDAWDFWTQGYRQDPLSVIKAFEEDTTSYDTMVFQANIPMWSLCVVGSTFVETPRGRIPIKYLKDGDLVYTVDVGTFRIGLAPCVNPRMTQKSAQLVRVNTNFDALLCTPDHKILTTNKGWVQAQRLRNGDNLIAIFKGICLQEYTVVYEVEHVDWQEDVWCMGVPGTHSFFANGIAVHNCAHHLAPFWGVAHVGYIPNGKIVGLSKLARIVDVFARRLQTQEGISCQVADSLFSALACRGVGVVLQCRHACMESRGVQKAGTLTITSALRGDMKDEPECRAEFLSFVNVATQGMRSV